MWYEDMGSAGGCTVLLLHGWCMSSAVWKFQLGLLSDSFRVIAPDIRGHGRSREISGGLTFDNFVNDLVDLFNNLSLSNVLLVGWSMGAQIAMQAFAELSDKIVGLVLVSATPRFAASDDFPFALAKSEARGMRLKVQRNTGKAIDGFYSRLFADGELEKLPNAVEIKELLSSIPHPDTATAIDALAALAEADMRKFLSAILVPTLIINGTVDQICTPESSTYLKEHISDARQKLFPLVGHAPFLTNPITFNDSLLKFSRSICDQHQ